MAAKFTLSDPIGSKYRIKIEGSGFLRQMGPRKLSKARAELRLAWLNEAEPEVEKDSENSGSVETPSDNSGSLDSGSLDNPNNPPIVDQQ